MLPAEILSHNPDHQVIFVHIVDISMEKNAKRNNPININTL